MTPHRALLLALLRPLAAAALPQRLRSGPAGVAGLGPADNSSPVRAAVPRAGPAQLASRKENKYYESAEVWAWSDVWEEAWAAGERQDAEADPQAGAELQEAAAARPTVRKVKGMEELVREKGYPLDRYPVETQDGYTLGLFRIPYGRKGPGDKRCRRPPVLLQHGIFDTSIAWVANDPHQSLGFILADLGYDVWLGNNRGNSYSQHHRILSMHEPAFWAYSYDQMAAYDLPAMVDFILQSSGAKSLAYVGHSEGSTQAFARLSQGDEYSKKISVMVGLAPVAYLRHQRVALWDMLSAIGFPRAVHTFGLGKFPLTWPHRLLGWGCKSLPWACGLLADLGCGLSVHLNMSRANRYVHYFPDISSTQNVMHYSDNMQNDRFSMFNYQSPEENMLHYNTSEPPVYRLEQIRVPVALFSGANDLLADHEDVARLMQDLRPGVVFRHLELGGYAHLDFIWASDAHRKLYPEVIQAIRGHLGAGQTPCM
mmetsp:Transcript_107843/g.348102  ORF Transcript_107843/g.348102 Transcript_107843/m.348102 type:complete len:484 (+) Transcript_107843:23-1474(+)